MTEQAKFTYSLEKAFEKQTKKLKIREETKHNI